MPKIFTIVFSISCLLLLAACVPDYRAMREREAEEADLSYIMVFEGEQISIDELTARVLLHVVLFEMEMGDIWDILDDFPNDVIDMLMGPGVGTAFERTKIAAVNELIDSLIIRGHAARNGIVITDEERTNVIAAAQVEVEMLDMVFESGFPISDEMFAEMILDDIYSERLLENIKQNIAINDPQFIEYFERYLQAAGNFINTIYLYSIVADTYENAQAAKDRLEAGENAFDVARDLSIDYGEGFERLSIRLPIRLTMAPNEVEPLFHTLFGMEKYKVTEIMPDGDNFVVIRIEEIIIPDNLDAVKEAYMNEVFAPQLFEIRLNSWRSASIAQINLPALESITLESIQEMFELIR